MPFQEKLPEYQGQVARNADPWSWGRSVYARAALDIYLFAFNGVTSTALTYLSCIDVWRPVVILILIFYAMVVPLLLLFRLGRHVRRSPDAWRSFQVRKYYGVLHESYQKRFWYWRFIILLRRLLLVATSVFFATAPTDKWALMSVLNVLSLLLQASFKPYGSDHDNRMETLSLTALCLVSVTMSTVGDVVELPSLHSVCLGLLVLVVLVATLSHILCEKVLLVVCVDRFGTPKGSEWSEEDSRGVSASMVAATSTSTAGLSDGGGWGVCRRGSGVFPLVALVPPAACLLVLLLHGGLLSL